MPRKRIMNKKIEYPNTTQKEKIFEFSTDEIGTKEYVDHLWRQGKLVPQFNIKTLEEILKKK